MKLGKDARLALQSEYENHYQNRSAIPKKAMVVKLTPEALEALQQNPQSFQVQFGDSENSGLHISDSFFPLNPVKETSPHELYLRAASQAKPNAPLQLQGQIIGKFLVEYREGDLSGTMPRESTVKHRNERQTVVLDAPDLPPPVPRKKKELTSMFRKPPRPSVHAKLVSASSTSGPPVDQVNQEQSNAKRPNVKSNSVSNDLRIRTIHCLALKERTEDALIKAVRASENDVREILSEIGERVPSSKSDGTAPSYRLANKAWLEVRPFTWPQLTDQERLAMSRTGRSVLKRLGISESDPAWEHVRFRTASSSAAPRAEVSDARQSGHSKDGKEKKSRAKTETKEIKIKDEGARASSMNSTISAAPRRTPGSGYKSSSRLNTSADLPNTRLSPSALPASASASSIAVPSRDPRVASSTATQRTKKVNADDVLSDRELLKEGGSIKRKISQRPAEDTAEESDVPLVVNKRRRTEDFSRSANAAPPRDLSLPKKPDVPLPRSQMPSLAVTEPMRRIKKESPPLQPPKKEVSPMPNIKREAPLPTSGTIAAPRKKSKMRREATYTSSEEDEPTPPPVPHKRSNSSTSSTAILPHATADNKSKLNGVALPSSHSDLRKLYNTEYLKSLKLMSSLLTQKAAIEQKLNKMGSASESESDLMDVDEFNSLAGDYRSCRDKLERIRTEFEYTSADSA